MVMAQVDVIIGRYDDAINELETLLSIQSWWTTTYILADPYFEPLHKIPRFNSMIKKYINRDGT